MRLMRAAWCMAMVAIAAVFGGGCCGPRGASGLTRWHATRVCMGVQARVVLYAPDEATAQRGLEAAYAEIGRLESLLSDYRPASELSRVSAAAGSGEWVAVSADTERVLRLGQRFAAETNGAFDMTAGAAVDLWRAARREGKVPSAEAVARAAGLVDWRALEVKAGAARLPRAGMRLDPGGIAKGDAAERAVKAVKRAGIPCVLVALAGDVAAGDAPPGEAAWRVDVRVDGKKVGLVRLVNACVSTSGDTEQFIEAEGVRYSHVIDPRTGWGVQHRHAATVVAFEGAAADALATALTVMTWEEAVAFARGGKGITVLLHRPGEETWAQGDRGVIDAVGTNGSGGAGGARSGGE